MLYAPFVKQVDKLDKDVAEMSLTDFVPKRFALNYEPPMISKYLPPSEHFLASLATPRPDQSLKFKFDSFEVAFSNAIQSSS